MCLLAGYGYRAEQGLNLRGWNRNRSNMDIGNKKRLKMKRQFEAGYPPGYECRQEWLAAGVLFGMGAVFSFHFFEELYDAYYKLIWIDMESERRIVEGAVAEPFMKLMEGRAAMFVPYFMFLGIMAVYHYFYYYQGAKSIYLMRRLPERGALTRSCIEGSLLCMGAGAAAIIILYLLYYGVYLLVVPVECLPRWG